MFRFCEECYRCKNRNNISSYVCNQMSHYEEYIKSVDISNIKFLEGEYLILCSYYLTRSTRNCYGDYIHNILTNYGRNVIWCQRSLGPSPKAEISLLKNLEGSDGLHSRPPPIYPEYDKRTMLTQEYIEILNAINMAPYFYNSPDYLHTYDHHMVNRILDVYHKYQEKTNEKLKLKSYKKILQKSAKLLNDILSEIPWSEEEDEKYTMIKNKVNNILKELW